MVFLILGPARLLGACKPGLRAWMDCRTRVCPILQECPEGSGTDEEIVKVQDSEIQCTN